MTSGPFHNPDTDSDALDDTVADVELEESLDQVEPGQASPAPVVLDEELGDYDPEAGQSRIADKSGIAGQIMSEAGMFVVGVCAALGGTSVLIWGLIMKTPQSLIAALVIAPPSLIWAFMKWRRWLGGAPYAYRLLMSLNEHEAADELLTVHREKQREQVNKKIAKLEAKGVKIKK